MTKILSVQEIHDTQNVEREEVEIPEWGGSVVVQGLSVETGLEAMASLLKDDGSVNFEEAMKAAVLLGIVEPKFVETDWEWLRQKQLAALTKITQAFIRLSGFDSASLKESRKNSSATDEGASSSL